MNASVTLARRVPASHKHDIGHEQNYRQPLHGPRQACLQPCRPRPLRVPGSVRRVDIATRRPPLDTSSGQRLDPPCRSETTV